MSTNPYFKELMSGATEEEIVARFTEQLNAAREAVEAEKARKAEEEAKAAAKESAFLHMAEAVINYVNEYANPKEPYSLDKINVKETMKTVDSYIKLAGSVDSLKIKFSEVIPKHSTPAPKKPTTPPSYEPNPIQSFLDFFFEE